MSHALAIILWALLVTLADSAAWTFRHFAAKRRAKRDVFPPLRTVATTLDDTIPF